MSYGERERVGTQMNKVKKDMKEKKSVGKKKKKKRWEMKSWAKICAGRMKFLWEHIKTSLYSFISLSILLSRRVWSFINKYSDVLS